MLEKGIEEGGGERVASTFESNETTFSQHSFFLTTKIVLLEAS